ncbi:MAG: amidase [Microthrixaceae bacterium]
MRDELTALVRSGEVHPRELVAEALRRIEHRDGELGAVVALRGDEALAEAESVARSRPLAGLPLLVKDLSNVAGMRTTMGSPWLEEAPVASSDDLVVSRLRAAGAIVVGKSNTPAFGHTGFTTNQVFGTTRNPWNTERSPGGSSGGSAAALSAGLVALATTSDGGGSVRLPASACGLVGYKPTTGAVGRDVRPSWPTFSTLGATATTVADVLTEARVIVGGTPGDPMSIPASATNLVPRSPTRVIATPTFRSDVDDDVRAAFDAACASFEAAGVEVELRSGLLPTDATLAWFTIACADLANALEPYRDRWDTAEDSLAFMLALGSEVSLSDYLAAERTRWQLAAAVDAIVAEAARPDTILMSPVANVGSWGPEGPLPTRAGSTDDPAVATNTTDLNMTGHPAVSVPTGTDAHGVPIGMQLVSARYDDGLALGAAALLERVAPWQLHPEGYTPFAI